jgi:hypothetical protein
MLRKTIYSMPIVILTIGAASAQTDMQELQDIKGGEISSRTQLEKKNDRDIDRAYESAIKRVPNPEKKKIDPWADPVSSTTGGQEQSPAASRRPGRSKN